MCRVIAIANQKGGVGKSTITSNLGIGLVNEGKKVLFNSNVYMDVKYEKLEYHRTHTILERTKIYATILRYSKKLNADYEGRLYLEMVRCFFTLPPGEREK